MLVYQRVSPGHFFRKLSHLGPIFSPQISKAEESHLREERQVLGTMLGQVLREPALVNLEVQMQKLRKATALRFFAMDFWQLLPLSLVCV